MGGGEYNNVAQGVEDFCISVSERTPACSHRGVFITKCVGLDHVWRGWGGPPFPMLQCIALYGIFDAVWSGFDDELLEKFAHEPSLPLKRVTLLDCNFPLHACTVVEAFRASGAKEFECDGSVPLWEADEWEQLEELGVSLTYWETSEEVEDEWWTLGSTLMRQIAKYIRATVVLHALT